MGEPVGPYTIGDDCGLCFVAGQTPKYVKVAFYGTDHDGNYALTQTEPCRWDYGGPQPALAIKLEHGPGASYIVASKNFAITFFDEELRCSVEYYDQFRIAWAYAWHGVHPAANSMIGSGYLFSEPKSRYEMLYRGDNKWTLGLRNLRVPANILVQFEPP